MPPAQGASRQRLCHLVLGWPPWAQGARGLRGSSPDRVPRVHSCWSCGSSNGCNPRDSSSRRPESVREAADKASGTGGRSSRGDKLRMASCLAKSASELSTVRDGGLFSGFQAQVGKKLRALKDLRRRQDRGSACGQSGRRNGWNVVQRPRGGGSPGPHWAVSRAE